MCISQQGILCSCTASHHLCEVGHPSPGRCSSRGSLLHSSSPLSKEHRTRGMVLDRFPIGVTTLTISGATRTGGFVEDPLSKCKKAAFECTATFLKWAIVHVLSLDVMGRGFPPPSEDWPQQPGTGLCPGCLPAALFQKVLLNHNG